MAKASRQVVPMRVPAMKAAEIEAPATLGNVEYVRKDLEALFPTYDIVRDCIAGEQTVKAAGVTYLPRPNPADTSQQNALRYTDYKTRAVFYNVTKRTLAGLSGQVFLRDPVVKLPPLLEPLQKDATGTGVPIEQLAQELEEYVIAYGRAGILADYPRTEGPTSRAQQLSGEVRPTLSVYSPYDVINWRTKQRGGRKVLSLVVIVETYISEDDPFELVENKQWRVLRLVDDVYTVTIYRKDPANNTKYVIHENEWIPRDSTGKFLDEIPFRFVGSRNNDERIDASPLYDLASVNMAHYRNSADYEESVYMVGQPTPVVAGVTEHWVKNVMGGTVFLGSTQVIPLPEGASAELLQAEANGLVSEAMEAKERQMVALGAKLVEQKTVQRTATEAGFEEASEASVLTTITKNCSEAVKWALEWCGLFAGAFTTRQDIKGEVLEFQLNTEFDLSQASPEEIKTAVENWLKEAITYSEMRTILKKAGQATLDDEDARAEMLRDRESEDFSKDAPDPLLDIKQQEVEGKFGKKKEPGEDEE